MEAINNNTLKFEDNRPTYKIGENILDKTEPKVSKKLDIIEVNKRGLNRKYKLDSIIPNRDRFRSKKVDPSSFNIYHVKSKRPNHINDSTYKLMGIKDRPLNQAYNSAPKEYRINEISDLPDRAWAESRDDAEKEHLDNLKSELVHNKNLDNVVYELKDSFDDVFKDYFKGIDEKIDKQAEEKLRNKKLQKVIEDKVKRIKVKPVEEPVNVKEEVRNIEDKLKLAKMKLPKKPESKELKLKHNDMKLKLLQKADDKNIGYEEIKNIPKYAKKRKEIVKRMTDVSNKNIKKEKIKEHDNEIIELEHKRKEKRKRKLDEEEADKNENIDAENERKKSIVTINGDTYQFSNTDDAQLIQDMLFHPNYKNLKPLEFKDILKLAKVLKFEFNDDNVKSKIGTKTNNRYTYSYPKLREYIENLKRIRK
jgi:hypothetical protein